ncbi:MAG: lipopolysaccharide kinase InaA family protein [Halioglobus sp.]
MHQLAAQLADDFLPGHWERVSTSAFSRVSVNRALMLYHKEYRRKSPLQILEDLYRGSRATRARHNAEALLLAGIDAPATVGGGKLPGGREYLFTSAAPGEGVDHWLRRVPGAGAAETLRQRRQLLCALGTFIGRVHATGFIHGDLRPDNIIAALQGEQFHFTLLNNERNTRKSPTPGRLLLRNLTQLNQLPPAVLSRTDRMRFFSSWRRQMRDLSTIEANVLAREAYQLAMRQL